MSYPSNYLSKVIFQANYLPLQQLKLKIDDDLETFIKSKIGVVEPQISYNQFVNFGVQQESSRTEINREPQWNFKGNPIHALINANWFQVITFEYSDFNAFHPIICEIFKKINNTYNPKIYRIALRYINNISFKEGNTFDFNDLIEDSLTSFTHMFKDYNLKRSMGSMEINNEEFNINTKFKFGFWNSTYPNYITKREFILDYDNSIIFDQANNTIETILQNLRSHNNKLFEKSIKVGLRNKMNNKLK